MTMGNSVVLVPLVSVLNDPEAVRGIVNRYATWLKGSYDVKLNPVSEAEALYSFDLGRAAGILALVVTGGSERLVQATASFGRPLMILAHESMNSLPAALEALSSLDQSRGTTMAFGQNDTELAKVERFFAAARALDRIRTHRIGLVGGPSSWLTYSLPDGKSLEARLGIKTSTITMEEFDVEYERAPKPLVAKIAKEARSKAQSVPGIPDEDFDKSARIRIALEELMERHKLTSISVRCFDFIGKYKATGCYAVSFLNDRGLVAGCEGDIPATVAMITLSEVTGSPTFLANPTYIRDHKLVLAHCTIAPKLTAGYRYRTHFESGLGVAISGSLKDGERVTVARYNPEYSVLRAGEGRIVKGDAWSEELCRTQAEIEMDGDAEIIKENPMGNHIVMAYGNHVDLLQELASLAGMRFEEI
jgi:L-fucose isomerase-like protein